MKSYYLIVYLWVAASSYLGSLEVSQCTSVRRSTVSRSLTLVYASLGPGRTRRRPGSCPGSCPGSRSSGSRSVSRRKRLWDALTALLLMTVRVWSDVHRRFQNKFRRVPSSTFPAPFCLENLVRVLVVKVDFAVAFNPAVNKIDLPDFLYQVG